MSLLLGRQTQPSEPPGKAPLRMLSSNIFVQKQGMWNWRTVATEKRNSTLLPAYSLIVSWMLHTKHSSQNQGPLGFFKKTILHKKSLGYREIHSSHWLGSESWAKIIAALFPITSFTSPAPNRGFPDSSVGKESTCNAGDPGSIPGQGRSPGEGKPQPFQYSGLENSMDCIVHGLAKSQKRLMNSLKIKRTTMSTWSVNNICCYKGSLEKEMATHSSVLAWRIPGMAESGGLPSVESDMTEAT